MFVVSELADRLIGAQDAGRTLAPITAGAAAFDIPAAYEVLAEIERRRRAQGWVPAGRKIGFTNRTIWARYGVYEPMWAHMWTHTVHHVSGGYATLGLAGFVQPRIEPEIVFGLGAAISASDDAQEILRGVAWIAAGFEIVQCHFPDWRFKAPDCTAAFGLHAALLVGTPVPVTDTNRAAFAAALPKFALTLRRGDEVIDRGTGENVLGSPALALGHLAGLVARQTQFSALAAGEIVTTGTITDAWPVAPGEAWDSDYGALALTGLSLRFL
ncbi:MAG: fumarylacetoacetate hydrolase family protein [Betaproteobacteria bacterium]